MRSAVTAASRLRAEVLALDGMVLIVDPGKPDKVIRITPLPDYLIAVREDQRAAKRPKKYVRDPLTGQERFEPLPVDPASEQQHVELNLIRMPHLEAFKLLEREINLRCPRDRTLPAPLAVAENIRDEWSALPEDVPVVDFSTPQDAIPEEARRPLSVPLEEIASYACADCDKAFPKKNALQLHIRSKHAARVRLEAREAKQE